MKTIGIIAEYNPFHRGHALQFKKIKGAFPHSKIIVIMGGHALQRGDFAVMDKWTRASLAIKNGADLVAELPYCYAGQTAERFAFGGVSLAEQLHCEMLSFGMEDQNFEAVKQVAALLAEEPAGYKFFLKAALAKGMGYAAARSEAVSQYFNEDLSEILARPNTILAVEYLKAIRKIHSAMIPLPVLREGSGYHDVELNSDFPSASALRKALLSEEVSNLSEYLPYPSEMLEPKKIRTARSNLSTQILGNLLRTDPEKLRRLPNITEGLEFALLNAVKYKQSLDDILSKVSSKRITKSRIRRILMNDLMDFTVQDFDCLAMTAPKYCRVLAFNQKGRSILRQLSGEIEIPLISNLHSNQTKLNAEGRRSMEFDCRTTDLFYLLRGEKEKIHADYVQHPIFVEEI